MLASSSSLLCNMQCRWYISAVITKCIMMISSSKGLIDLRSLIMFQTVSNLLNFYYVRTNAAVALICFCGVRCHCWFWPCVASQSPLLLVNPRSGVTTFVTVQSQVTIRFGTDVNCQHLSYSKHWRYSVWYILRCCVFTCACPRDRHWFKL